MSGDELSALLSSFEAAENARGAAQPVDLPAPDVSASSLEPPRMSNEEIRASVARFHEHFGLAQPVDGPAPDNLAGSRQLHSEEPLHPHAFDFPPGEAHFHPGGVTQQGTYSLSCILTRADCVSHRSSSPPSLSPPPLPERVGHAVPSECLSDCPSRRPDKQQHYINQRRPDGRCPFGRRKRSTIVVHQCDAGGSGLAIRPRA